MFTELWKGLGGAFDKRWLLHVFSPALLFWGAGLWVWMQLQDLSEVLKLWQSYATETQFFYGIAGFLLVVFTALLLESFTGSLLRFYEGYWPWGQRAAQRRAKSLRKKQTRQQTLRAKLVSDEITSQERVELGRLADHLRHRPQEPESSMPTQLGDILRAAEDYPRQHYGLDPIILWPRIYPQLSDSLREALGATQAQLDLALRLTTLASLYGLTWSIVVAFSRAWLVLTWTLPAFPLAWLFWRSAHPAAVSYAGLFRSAFDLHRGDVYAALRWPKPTSPAEEMAQGQRLMLYLTDHVVPQGLTYADVENLKPEAAASEKRPTSFWKWLFGSRPGDE